MGKISSISRLVASFIHICMCVVCCKLCSTLRVCDFPKWLGKRDSGFCFKSCNLFTWSGLLHIDRKDGKLLDEVCVQIHKISSSLVFLNTDKIPLVILVLLLFQVLLKKFNDFKQSVQSQSESFKACNSLARRLVAEGHSDTVAIKDRQDSLR